MNIIPFDSGKVPAAVTSMFGDSAGELVGNNPGGGFPVISIKGKVFHIQRGDERTLITKPGEDDPAASIEVVVLRANPNRSKVFYAEGYQEGEKSKPTCYSNSGIAPEADAKEPQAKKCATCAHNQWGARITQDGRKAKACSDSRRIAISTVETPRDPMQVRVPAASMKSLEEYGKILAARGIPPQAVVTKIGFDYSVAHPALTFKPVGLIGDPVLLNEIKTISESDLVGQITGTKAAAFTAAPSAEDVEEAPAPKATQAVKPAAAKPAVKPAAAEPAVAAPAAPKKVAAKVEVAPAQVASGTEKMGSEIEGMLDGLDFDD
jgi:hypothetical protein